MVFLMPWGNTLYRWSTLDILLTMAVSIQRLHPVYLTFGSNLVRTFTAYLFVAIVHQYKL